MWFWGPFLPWIVGMIGVFSWPFLTDSPSIGDDLTRRTVWVALAYYAVAAWSMLHLGPSDWRVETAAGRRTRCFWTFGWAAFVIHVGMAFHFIHKWSHAAAVDHVRERSGVGEGVYVSYLFTLAWTVDVAWWWSRPTSYAFRPRFVDWLLHAFMAMMVFAGTVICEQGPIRYAGIVLIGTLLVRCVTRFWAPAVFSVQR
jgi:hypothetical protein